MKYSRLLAICMIFGLLATVGVASAETTLPQWWQSYFGTSIRSDWVDHQATDTFVNHIPGQWKITLEQCGDPDGQSSGWYDASETDPNGSDARNLTMHTIFAGSDDVGKTVMVDSINVSTFGIWMQNDSPNAGRYDGQTAFTRPFTFFSEDVRNEPALGVSDTWNTGSYAGTAGRHALVFDLQEELGVDACPWGGWVIAWDNWPGDDTARDTWRETFNDHVIIVEKTPELPPSALLMVGSLPLGMAYIRGRRRKGD